MSDKDFIRKVVIVDGAGSPTGSGTVEYNETPPTLTDGQMVQPQSDSSGNTKVTLATNIAGEDLTADVMKVEHRYSASALLTADALVKTGAGYVHTVTISCDDAAPTAGTITIFDNTAESGTELFSWTLTTAVFNPVTVILDVPFATGLYVGFTTTADVNVLVSFR